MYSENRFDDIKFKNPLKKLNKNRTISENILDEN